MPIQAEDPIIVSEEEFRKCRKWYEDLNLTPLKDLPLVSVATGDSYSIGENEYNSYYLGFLSGEKEGPDGSEFEITSLTRNKVSFIRTDPDVSEASRIGYERLDFNREIEMRLQAESDQAANNDLPGWAQGNWINSEPSSPPVITVHLAMESYARGHEELALRLINLAALQLRERLPQNNESDLITLVQNAFAHILIWNALVACDEPSNDRIDLLDRFEQVLKVAPESKYSAAARKMAETLQRMIKEDARRAEERKETPFEELSKEEKIRDLVFQLRNQDGAQFSQPGSCNIFSLRSDDDSPANQIVENYGFEAVPFLIEALTDESLTYSVEFHRNFYFSHHVLTVGDAAVQILERITGEQLPAVQRIRIFGEDPEQNPNADWRQTQIEAASRWWQEFEEKGERRFLIETVSAGGSRGGNLAETILKKYPDDAPSAMKTGLEQTNEEWAYYRYVWTIGNAKFESSEEIIRSVIRENRFNGGTMAALEQLYRAKPKDSIQAASRLLDLDETWESDDSFGDTLAIDIVEFLTEQGDQEAMAAVLKNIEKLGVRQRIGVSTGMIGFREPEKPKEALILVEKILASFLVDRRRLTGTSGIVGDLRYSDPRISDLAAYAMADNWPDQYAFDYQATLRTRDRKSLEILNQWRAKQELTPLPSTERAIRHVEKEEFLGLVSKHGDLTKSDNLELFIKTVMTEGVTILPQLVDWSESVSVANGEKLRETIQSLSNRVESISIDPKIPAYKPVREWADTMKGKSLDGNAVVSLMTSFYGNARENGEKYRGLSFEAIRHEDFSGIEITIKMTEKENPGKPLDQWNGSERVLVGGEEIHRSDYGGGLSKEDPAESEDLRNGVDEALSHSPSIACEIRWRLVGIWHD